MNQTGNENRSKPQPRIQTPIFDQLIVATVVVLVYLPAALYKYAFTDDFLLFFSDQNLTEIYLAAGRPALALAWLLVHEHVTNVGDLCWIRMIGIVGTALLGAHVYSVSAFMTRDRFIKIVLALSVAMLPGITVLAAWATCSLFPYSAVLALMAADFTIRAIRAIDRNKYKRSAFLIALSFALLSLSAAIYQPTTSWFWLVPLMCVLNKRWHFNRRYRLRILKSIGVGFVQFCGLLILLKLFFLLGDFEAQERAAFLKTPAAKFVAFAEIQVPLALNQWQVIDVSRKDIVVAISAVSMLIILVGIFAATIETTRAGRHASKVTSSGRLLTWFLWLGLVIFLLLLAHAHWLATDYSAKNYRTATAFTAGITLLIGWSLMQIATISRDADMRAKILRVCFCLMLLIAIMKGTHNLNHYWIGPYSTGFRFLTDQISNGVKPETKRIHIIRQQAGEGIVTEQNIYVFGRPFSDMEWEWAPEALARSALIESGKIGPDANRPREFEVSSSVTGESLPAHVGSEETLLIDMRQLMQWRR